MNSRIRRASVCCTLSLAALLLIMSGCRSDEEAQSAVPELDPLAAELLTGAEAALERDQYATALTLVDSAAQITGVHPRIHFVRGSILLATGRLADSEDELRRTLALADDFPGAWYSLGNASFRQGSYREAVKAYSRGLARHPAAQTWHNLGSAYESLGIMDSAAHAFDQAIAFDSTYAAAYASKAELLERQGRFEQGLSAAEAAVSHDPDDARNRLILGSLLLKSGRPADALPHFGTIVQAQPWNYSAIYSMGIALQRTGRTEEAGQFLAQATAVRDDQYRIRRLETAVGVSPDSVKLWMALGSAYQELGRFEDALKAFLVAESLEPDHLLLQLNIATLLRRQDRPREALFRYQRLLRQDSTFAEAWLNLGSYFLATGQSEEAQFALQRAQHFKPSLQPVIDQLKARSAQ